MYAHDIADDFVDGGEGGTPIFLVGDGGKVIEILSQVKKFHSIGTTFGSV